MQTHQDYHPILLLHPYLQAMFVLLDIFPAPSALRAHYQLLPFNVIFFYQGHGEPFITIVFETAAPK